MDPLKQLFNEKSQALGKEVKELLKEHGQQKVDEVTLDQVYGGMRNITCMVWEPSLLDSEEGIRFRGYSIPELQEKLPRAPNGKEPLPEGLFWLMLVGEIPTKEQVKWLTENWVRRANVPEHVFRTIDTLPVETHPMTQLSVGVMAMQNTSVFAQRYASGMNRTEYWDATYEDTMNLIARLPRVAAYIYRRVYFNGEQTLPDISLDWAGNYAHLLGIEDSGFKEYMRLFMTIHADHEGGNASAHTTHLVGSTLSDPYLSFSAAMNALAGPLHGLANQEVIRWVLKMVDTLGTTKPSREQISEYVKSTLTSGRVIPGYGHAVLRKPDPRFMAQRQFAEDNVPESDLVKIVWKVFDVVPPILSSLGKVKNPWPNVDAHSGALLMHYGLKQHNYYTVLFAVSRALGVLAAQCWARAMYLPLERPKSVTTAWLKEFVAREVDHSVAED
ncbi:MAG: citrate (Si)-synthase, eukaryotic [Lewinellaceae bacterium]|nr:citrate (Si)-synthase, eukaryotic [Saprospiraceae bacterium]MCB9317352.1 citrate (Si)-synthase, eukaryotic [Lewinellaceae bacterium]MCB9331969.1 citrate (Si)-synthase, eukaryotic [Lewinellaceae bacterium]